MNSFWDSSSVKKARIERDKAIKVALAEKAIPIVVIAGITLIICTIIICAVFG